MLHQTSFTAHINVFLSLSTSINKCADTLYMQSCKIFHMLEGILVLVFHSKVGFEFTIHSLPSLFLLTCCCHYSHKNYVVNSYIFIIKGKNCYSKDSEIRVFMHFSITTPYEICFVEFLTNHKN